MSNLRTCVLATALVLPLQVRQTAVSRDGSVVLASCEDGVIYRFDKGRADVSA